MSRTSTRRRAQSTSSSSSSSEAADVAVEEQLAAEAMAEIQAATQMSASMTLGGGSGTQQTNTQRTTNTATTTPQAALTVTSVTLSGFKSYADASVTNLSPHCNVVVGANGSGKSNLFSAFEFVLGERDFSNLSPAERQELLHESSPDQSSITAFVEICFDNSDQRIPLDTPEVVLRRTIGVKKDEFFVNKKHVSKAEVANLMEAAGFSKSNPYYIVRQGRVNELCVMKDAQRLQLIKEIAGTTVYDVRRKETEQLLVEAQAKCAKIDESLSHIVARLDELQEEKQDLEEFSLKDRERRALTYLISEKELANAERDLDNLEVLRNQAAIAARAEADELVQMHDTLEAKEEALRFLQNELNLQQQAHRMALDRRASLAKVRARRELDLRDAEERQSAREDKIQQAKQRLAEVEAEIANAEDEVRAVEPQLAEQEKIRMQAASEVDRLERKRKVLEAKSRHANIESRNQWLDQETASLRASLQAMKDLVATHGQRVGAQQVEREEAEKKLEECEKLINDNQDVSDQTESKAAKTRSLRDQKSAERKEAWRLHDDSSKAEREAQEKMKKAQRDLWDNLPAAVSAGLDAVERVAEELGLSRKVYGPLISLFTVESPTYNTAVEVAAGNQLMHVVVEDDETASRLMEELLSRKAGRVTFKPLNVLQSRGTPRGGGDDDDDEDETATNVATEEQPANLSTEDGIPLISKLNYQAKFAPAIRAALGRTLLCRNAHVASQCAKRFKVDCVTLEGDQVGKRGALTGGFHDMRRSRLAASAVISQAKEAFSTAQARAEEAKSRAAALDQEVARLAGEIDKLEMTRLHLSTARAALTQERVKLQRRVQAMLPATGGSAVSQAAAMPTAAQIAEVEAQIDALETQRNAPGGDSPLTEEEKTELESDALLVARQVLARAQDDEQASRARWNKLKNELDVNLLRRRDELQSVVEQSGGVSSSSQQTSVGDESSTVLVNSARADLETAKADEADAAKQVDDVNEAIAARKKELADLKAELDELKDAELQVSERVAAAEDAVDKVLDNRSVAVRAKEVAARKIRELGSLSSAELDKHRHLSVDELTSAVVQATNALKRFGLVNKKALDQYVNFSEQRQALVQRQSEATVSHTKIRELIGHLDRQKDEAIKLTFKIVAKHFREVFSELVPNGVGTLQLVKAKDADEQLDDDKTPLEDFVGMSPRVSFSGGQDSVPMQLLSGGQKALVALTLIFAIQRCDPAPFYLFDEIDQALDANHRSAVADLIRRQARNKKRAAQFIVTTFRPEMVQAADKWFGIKFAHKVSTVGAIDKAQAMKFVRKIEEKLAVTTAPGAVMEADEAAVASEEAAMEGEVAQQRPKRSRR